MPRAEPLIRQWNLLKALQAHHFGISTEDLAARIHCSKRQVLRDLHVLEEIGFPISFDVRHLGRRYWTLRTRIIERQELVFSVTEMLSLYLSQQLLAPLGGTELGGGLAGALEKIKALLPAKALQYFAHLDRTLVVKTVGTHDYSDQSREIALLNQAIAENRVVALRYRSTAGSRPIDTQYHPYGMIFLEGNLYCLGHLCRYNQIRTIKIDRILRAALTEATFQRPRDFSLQDYIRGSFGIIADGRPQAIRVQFTGWAAPIVRERRWHPSQTVLDDSGPALVAQFTLTNTMEFKRWILSFGRHAVVQAPADFAAELRRELQATCAAYETPAALPAPAPAKPSGQKVYRERDFAAPLL